MKTAGSSNIPRKAFVILFFQLIAWGFILISFFDDYSVGYDAAGAGMARGFAVFFVDVPCMFFIFLSTFYFLKDNLPKWFRYISIFNYFGVFLVFASINW
ncbi:hypothetical protein [Colwellia sp. E2M01]|uniref:hypothetical protein n=1 Tax=Colwellia sp. E2M01 TaxID=2841561 RepID=UPI001C0A56F1|nr:hypothetical protein [Colwellia sp. E2M01]MBU2871390.1 hypothetical protein [Colwellia sp. E2M01]